MSLKPPVFLGTHSNGEMQFGLSVHFFYEALLQKSIYFLLYE